MILSALRMNILKKLKKNINDKYYNFGFGKKKYYYIIVTKPNILLTKKISNSEIFKKKNWLKNIFYENSNYITESFEKITLQESFELYCIRVMVTKIEVPANALKHLFGLKSLHNYVTVTYDTETMLEKLDETELK